MHLVVDGQALQSDSLKRGVGRYSLRLLSALLETRGDARVTCALNADASASGTVSAHEALRPLVPLGLRVTMFHAPRLWRRSARRLLGPRSFRELALLDLDPDAVLILGAHQRSAEVVVGPRTWLTNGVRTAVVLYDLIPMQYPQDFLYTRSMQREYELGLSVLQDADCLLAISESTAEVWREHFAGGPDVSVIGGGPFLSASSEVNEVPLESRRGVLLVGSESPTKNISSGIRAFRSLPEHVQRQHPLVVVGIRATGAVRDVQRMASSCEWIHVEGYVSDARLAQLMAESRVVLAVSTAEGLGLPPLEAAGFGTPALVADRGSLAEFARDPRSMVDPYKPDEIASRLEQVLTDDRLWRALSDRLPDVCASAAWPSVAQRAWDALANGSRIHPSGGDVHLSVGSHDRIDASMSLRERAVVMSNRPVFRDGVVVVDAELLRVLGSAGVSAMLGRDGVVNRQMLVLVDARRNLVCSFGADTAGEAGVFMSWRPGDLLYVHRPARDRHLSRLVTSAEVLGAEARWAHETTSRARRGGTRSSHVR